ncbi:MAG TPA: DUF433 domain-containing protein, partial [Candidatus Acidoferrum sp.]|nr:DUF433 domain-containing protein [Candidatus Acidoferrum sp.]
GSIGGVRKSGRSPYGAGTMIAPYNKLYEESAYGIPEAAVYLKVPYTTLRYWLTGFGKQSPIIVPAESGPTRLSFLNLLECHALAAMRKMYDLKLPKVRSALRKVSKDFPQPHPLISEVFLTDRKDLFIERMGQTINVSQPHNQLSLDFYRMHLERLEIDPKGFRFFPFVVEPKPSEPKTIEINPMVGFGKPIIAGTGISTAIIASRFNARESIAALTEEYGCTPEQIEEAIRWESGLPVAA